MLATLFQQVARKRAGGQRELYAGIDLQVMGKLGEGLTFGGHAVALKEMGLASDSISPLKEVVPTLGLMPRFAAAARAHINVLQMAKTCGESRATGENKCECPHNIPVRLLYLGGLANCFAMQPFFGIQNHLPRVASHALCTWHAVCMCATGSLLIRMRRRPLHGRTGQ